MPHNHGVAPWSGNFYPAIRPLPVDVMNTKNSAFEKECQMGTWGVALKPTLKHKVLFTRPFRLKQAVLDSTGFVKQDFLFRVMLVDNKDDQIPLTLCILSKQMMNQTLDLEFEEGDDVTFYVKTDVYNMDANSFSVSLSGITTRTDDAFDKRPSALSSSRSANLINKNRSSSLPDEYYHNRIGIPSSPLAKTPPLGESSTNDNSSKSISAKLLRAESLHEEKSNVKNSEPPALDRRGRSFKKSFKSADVLGKFGKYLSKS